MKPIINVFFTIFAAAMLTGCGTTENAGITNLSEQLTRQFAQFQEYITGNSAPADPALPSLPLPSVTSEITAATPPSANPSQNPEITPTKAPLVIPSATTEIIIPALPSPSPINTATAMPSAKPSADTFTALTPTRNTSKEILALLDENDRQISELNLQSEQLKLKYRNGELSYEDYTAQKTELELAADELRINQDALELELYSAANGVSVVSTGVNKTQTPAAPSVSAVPVTTSQDANASNSTTTVSTVMPSPKQSQNNASTGYNATKKNIADREAAIESRRQAIIHRLDDAGSDN